MVEEIRQYLKDNGVLCTDANLETMEEAREFVKELDRMTPSDEIIERCMREGIIMEKDDEGNWKERTDG